MVANNQSIIYDIEANTERMLPDIPNNVRVTNPMDGSAILLPLSPPDFIPEVLVCGGTQTDTIDPSLLTSQTPATTQCSRIRLDEAGIARGWEVEHMLEPRTMPELVHLPNGQVLIAHGGRTGFAAIASVRDPVGNSNADHAVLVPSLYTPDAPLGRRISNRGMPSSGIARLYHSSVTLTPQGNFLIAGSNPNNNSTVGPDAKFPSEFRVQTLDPPFMFVERPRIMSTPKKLAFNTRFTVPIALPLALTRPGAKVQGEYSFVQCHTPRKILMDARRSRGDGPRVLDARVPLERTPRLYGRGDLRRPAVAHVHDSSERARFPAGPGDYILDGRRRDERGCLGYDGEWKLASDGRVGVYAAFVSAAIRVQ